MRRKRGHDAVHIGLRADNPGVRVVLGLPDEMLAAAEADFEPGFFDCVGEKRCEAALAGGWLKSSRKRSSPPVSSEACRGDNLRPLLRPKERRGPPHCPPE